MTIVAAILWALAAVALSLLGLALVVLALPVHLRIRAAVHDGEPSGAVRVAWAFGLVAGELTPRGLAVRVAGARVHRARLGDLFRRRARRREAEAGSREERRAQRAREGKRGRGGLAAAVEHRGTLLRIFRRLGGTLHLRLRVRGTVGLDDPADTARLASALAAIGALPGVELTVELDWLDETLEGDVVGGARLWVPETAAVALALLFERRSRAAVRALAG